MYSLCRAKERCDEKRYTVTGSLVTSLGVGCALTCIVHYSKGQRAAALSPPPLSALLVSSHFFALPTPALLARLFIHSRFVCTHGISHRWCCLYLHQAPWAFFRCSLLLKYLHAIILLVPRLSWAGGRQTFLIIDPLNIFETSYQLP